MCPTRLTTSALESHNDYLLLNSLIPNSRQAEEDTYSIDSLMAWGSEYAPLNDEPTPPNDMDDNLDLVDEYFTDDRDPIPLEEQLASTNHEITYVEREIAAAHPATVLFQRFDESDPATSNIDFERAIAEAQSAQGNSVLSQRAVELGEIAPLETQPEATNVQGMGTLVVSQLDATNGQQLGISGNPQLDTTNGQQLTMPNYRNTTGSSFSDIVKRGFIEYMERKGTRAQAFGREKYANYFAIVRDGPRSRSAPPGYSRLERDWWLEKRKNVYEEFEIIDDELYRRNPRRKVVIIERALEEIDKHHSTAGHAGITTTWAHVHAHTYGIVVDDVAWLIKHCTFCRPNEVTATRAPLNPIVSLSPMERVQMDLVDLRKHPSGLYHWFVHLKDHFLKTSWVYPLKGKHSVGVAKILNRWMRIYGCPRMIQCDNGKEFKGMCIRLLKKRGVRMINGRPRHPQSQGLVEQGNGVIKRKMTKWKEQNKRLDWSGSLDFISKAINTSRCQGLPGRYTPHYAMYGVIRDSEYDKNLVNYEMSKEEVRDYFLQDDSDLDMSIRAEAVANGNVVISASEGVDLE